MMMQLLLGTYINKLISDVILEGTRARARNRDIDTRLRMALVSAIAE
jgi:hypothetical protein